MASNSAAWMDGQGQKLRVGPAEMPKPGAGEIVVRNHAVAINPVDWKVQDWGVLVQKWPTVIGTDLAGEVVEVGVDVTNFKKGDRVVAHAMSLVTGDPRHGAHQLYTIVPAATTAILPSNISYTAGSVLPIAIDTAAIGLSLPGNSLDLPLPSLNVPPQPCGKTIVVWGGSSSVGALAIQLATAAGVKVVSVSSSHNFDFCRSNGAVDTYDYKSDSVVDDVVNAVQKAGGEFAGVYDAISEPETFKLVVEVVEKLGGGHVSVVAPGLPKTSDKVKVHQVFGVNQLTHKLWSGYITQALQEGKLKCVPEAFVVGKGLESIQEGYDKNKAGVSARKLVIELA